MSAAYMAISLLQLLLASGARRLLRLSTYIKPTKVLAEDEEYWPPMDDLVVNLF